MGNIPSVVQVEYTQKARTILRQQLHMIIKGIAESYANGMSCVENKAWIHEFLTDTEYIEMCTLLDKLYKMYPQQRKNPRAVNEIGHSMQNKTAIDLAGRFGV